MKLNKLLKISLFLVVLLSVIVNIVVIFHAYNFTHFSTTIKPKTKSPSNLSFIEKLSILTLVIADNKISNDEIKSKAINKIKKILEDMLSDL